MDLRRLELFLAVVDHGTVTQAAAASYVSQPAVSQAVRHLEAELGVQLFERVGRTLRLTAAGDALVPAVRRARRAVDDGLAAVAAVVGIEAGVVPVGCLPTLVQRTVDLIGVLRAEHPGVDVRLVEAGDPLELASLVVGGTVDVGLTDLSRSPRSLVSHDLGSEALVAVLPPGADAATALTPDDLARLPLLSTPPGTSSRTALDSFLALSRVEARHVVVVDQREALLPLVLDGAGAALLPPDLARRAEALGASVRPTKPPVARRIGILHRRGELAPAVAAFVEIARRR